MGASAGVGYPRNIFIYESSEKLEDLECCICLNICNDPKQCPNGHMFCKECIENALASQPKCPTCRVDLNRDKLGASLYAKKQINALRVRCPIPHVREDDTCPWTGKVEELPSHMDTCEYQNVKCTNDYCNAYIIRKDVFEHLSTCPYQLVECGLCEQMYVRRDKESHDEECEGKLEACPNDGCGTICVSKDLAAHRTTCEFERIRCRLHEEGLCGEHCPRSLLRRDWCAHLYSPITVDALMENAIRMSKRLREVESASFTEAELIEAKWEGGSRWCRGVVVKRNTDGSYHVKYDDGDEEEAVSAQNIRPRPTSTTTTITTFTAVEVTLVFSSQRPKTVKVRFDPRSGLNGLVLLARESFQIAAQVNAYRYTAFFPTIS